MTTMWLLIAIPRRRWLQSEPGLTEET